MQLRKAINFRVVPAAFAFLLVSCSSSISRTSSNPVIQRVVCLEGSNGFSPEAIKSFEEDQSKGWIFSKQERRLYSFDADKKALIPRPSAFRRGASVETHISYFFVDSELQITSSQFTTKDNATLLYVIPETLVVNLKTLSGLVRRRVQSRSTPLICRTFAVTQKLITSKS